MPKEIDWSFYVKIVIAGIFLFFVLIIVLFGHKAFQPLNEDHVKMDSKQPKTNYRQPIRMQLIVLNTFSLFFMLMSIQEYRLNEFMSPFGVDPEKIPSQCKTQQQLYYWIVLTCAFALVLYNFFVHFMVLKKASAGNVIMDNPQRVSSYVSAIDKLTIKNGGFVVQKYPFVPEYLFSVFLALFSGITYIMFVLINYNVVESKIFRPCFHPQNTSRFYDPFVEQ